MLYSGNILYDPGVELHVGNGVTFDYHPETWEAQTGAQHYVIPRIDVTKPYGQVWPNGDAVDYQDIAQWMQHTEPMVLTNTASDSAWHVTRDSPYAGKFSLVWWRWDASAAHGGNGHPGGLCIQGPGLPPGYSARVTDGALVTWSLKTKVVSAHTSGTPSANLFLYLYSFSGTPVSATTSGAYQTLTSSYETLSVSTRAPRGSYFVRCGIVFSGSPTGGLCATFVDSGILSVER